MKKFMESNRYRCAREVVFEEVLGIKSILMGFGLGADAIHSPNENYPLEQFFNGIRTIPLFYKHFVEDVH